MLVVLVVIGLGLVILLPAFRRLSPPGTLRARPGIAAAVACVILLTIGFFGFEFFIPLALTDLRNQSSLMAGLPLTASALTWTAGAWIVDQRSRVYSRSSMLLRAGYALITIGILLSLGVFVTEIPVWCRCLPGRLQAWVWESRFPDPDAEQCWTMLRKGARGRPFRRDNWPIRLGIALGVGIGGSIIGGDQYRTRSPRTRGFLSCWRWGPCWCCWGRFAIAGEVDRPVSARVAHSKRLSAFAGAGTA